MRGNTVFVIDLMDQFFTLVFVLEVVLRSLVFGWRETIFGGIYRFLDFLLVMVTGVLLTWILEPMDMATGFWGNLQVLRVLRLIRIVRVVRSIPFFHQVYLIGKHDDVPEEFKQKYFSSVTVSMFSMLQVV